MRAQRLFLAVPLIALIHSIEEALSVPAMLDRLPSIPQFLSVLAIVTLFAGLIDRRG